MKLYLNSRSSLRLPTQNGFTKRTAFSSGLPFRGKVHIVCAICRVPRLFSVREIGACLWMNTPREEEQTVCGSVSIFSNNVGLRRVAHIARDGEDLVTLCGRTKCLEMYKLTPIGFAK